MTDFSTISLHQDPHVAWVTLARPALRNAFNDTTIRELRTVFESFALQPSLRAVVLKAEGPAFCAGADLNWMRAMADYSWAENQADAQNLANMLWAIYSCPVPVVAQVQGDAYAGGVGLVSACDIVLAADHAQFCLSEAKLGLVPATIAPYVIRALGERAARRYFTTAERFDASTAQRLGLVHEVFPAEGLASRTQELVQALVANGPDAVRACKRLVLDVAGQSLTPALREHTARLIADVRASDEGREGVQSFLQKRSPSWRADAGSV